MMEKMKDPGHAARYLTKALEYGDPVNLQCGLLDVIRAQGGYHEVASKSGLSEWRLKLILFDEEECWKLIRLGKLLKGMGLRLVIVEMKKQK